MIGSFAAARFAVLAWLFGRKTTLSLLPLAARTMAAPWSKAKSQSRSGVPR